MFVVVFFGSHGKRTCGVYQYELAAKRHAARIKRRLAHFGCDTRACRVLVK